MKKPTVRGTFEFPKNPPEKAPEEVLEDISKLSKTFRLHFVSYVDAGFSEEQAMELIKLVFTRYV